MSRIAAMLNKFGRSSPVIGFNWLDKVSDKVSDKGAKPGHGLATNFSTA